MRAKIDIKDLNRMIKLAIRKQRRDSFDVEDILSLGGGEAVYSRITG